mgnify:CR=1 FL=1
MTIARADSPPRPIVPEDYRAQEEYVADWLKATGFIVEDATYHTVFSQRGKSLMQRRSSPTALVIRHRADRIAIHPELEVEFHVEIKSESPDHYGNMLLEMLPLAMHVIDHDLYGTKCLYAYIKNENRGRQQHGFWVHDRPSIDFFRITYSWQERSTWLLAIARRAFGDSLRVKYAERRTGGSDDPYVQISENSLCALPDWRNLVLEEIGDEDASLALRPPQQLDLFNR